MTETPGSANGTRHLRLGWWSLLVFLTLGFVLEALHGFKIGYYLDVDNETRRMMWRLAHAHGTLLSVVQIGYGLTCRLVPLPVDRLASQCMLGAMVLIPLGFFLGGVWIHGGDPGLGVLLVPPGALLLFLGVLRTARALKKAA